MEIESWLSSCIQPITFGSPSFRVKDGGGGRDAIDCARERTAIDCARECTAIDCARERAAISRVGAINCAPTTH